MSALAQTSSPSVLGIENPAMYGQPLFQWSSGVPNGAFQTFLVARTALRFLSCLVVKNKRWNSRVESGAASQHHWKNAPTRIRRSRSESLVSVSVQSSAWSSGATPKVQTALMPLTVDSKLVLPARCTQRNESYSTRHGCGAADQTRSVSSRSDRYMNRPRSSRMWSMLHRVSTLSWQWSSHEKPAPFWLITKP